MVPDAMFKNDKNKDGYIDRGEAAALCADTWKYLTQAHPELVKDLEQRSGSGANYESDQAFFFFTQNKDPEAMID